jgi:hypothetical protein
LTISNNIKICKSQQLLGTDKLKLYEEILKKDLISDRDIIKSKTIYLISRNPFKWTQRAWRERENISTHKVEVSRSDSWPRWKN